MIAELWWPSSAIAKFSLFLLNLVVVYSFCFSSSLAKIDNFHFISSYLYFYFPNSSS